MKPIKFNAILSGVSTKSDGSLSLRVSTPEFTSEEQTLLFKLCRINLDCTLQPLGEPDEAPVEVKNEINAKTPSKRLRAVLFILWKSEKETHKIPADQSFEMFYEQRMEKIISWVKEKLPDEN